jgi:regulator of protease activity HflC (stomatin/prohibitin superfamily)
MPDPSDNNRAAGKDSSSNSALASPQKPAEEDGINENYPVVVAFLADAVIFLVLGIGGALVAGALGLAVGILFAIILVAMLSIRIINEWNRMPVLRLGNYVGIIGPGLRLIVPLIESTPITLDTRVLGTPFKAEKTLTKDNVPVDVDAILFWKVVNPEGAVLNVQSYLNAVQLSAQTAMRDVIGKSELSIMLAGRDVIGKDIQDLIQERVNDWGIKAISVEIRDVVIPPELQSAMARVATAEREKQARVKLAESESLAADKMLEAAAKYKKDMYAMQLRSLNMMYEISLNGKNLIVFIPTDNKGFSIPTPFGVAGIEKFASDAQKKQKPQG